MVASVNLVYTDTLLGAMAGHNNVGNACNCHSKSPIRGPHLTFMLDVLLVVRGNMSVDIWTRLVCVEI